MQPDEEKQIDAELNAIDFPIVTPPAHLSIQPKKKRHIVRNIIVTLLVLAFLAAASYVGWLLVKPLEPAKTDTSQINTTAAKLTAEKLIADIKPGILGEVKETAKDGGGSIAQTFNAPLFRPDGFEFSVRASTDSGFASYGTKVTIAGDLLAIGTALKAHGLTATILDPGSDTSTYQATYQSADITCALSDQKPYVSTQQYITTIGCADKTSYVENAKTLQPYYAVYKADSGDTNTDIAMSSLSTKDSKTAGYTTTTISIGGASYDSVGGFAGLFYTTPDKIIHYFRGTQNILACEVYDTTDLKKAYLGESCSKVNDETAVVTL